MANIRGGGEFGPKWHQAALKADRHKAYEDFIAVGEDLVRRKVTSPAAPGRQGTEQWRPPDGQHAHPSARPLRRDRLRIPLLDMKRFNHLLAGASWMGEYGNPDIPERVVVHPHIFAVS